MSAVAVQRSPASVLLDAAPDGLTTRELQAACLGPAPTQDERAILQTQLDELAHDGQALFIRGSDRWHWQQRRTAPASNGSTVAPAAGRWRRRTAPPLPPATPAPPPPSKSPANRAHTGTTREILRVLTDAGRPMRAREVSSVLHDHDNVSTLMKSLVRRGTLLRDRPHGLYRLARQATQRTRSP